VTTLTLNDHLEKFEKVINCKWKKENEKKQKIDIKIKTLRSYYRQPHEKDDFVLLELFNMYLLGGYDKKYDPTRGGLMTYVTVFIDSHLDFMLDQRRKRDLWDQGERVLKQNGFEKRICFKSCDVYDKNYRESLPYDDRDIRISDLEDPESILLGEERRRLLWHFAKEKNRIDETKILLGLEDYHAVSTETGISKDTIRKRISRLVDDFNEYYDALDLDLSSGFLSQGTLAHQNCRSILCFFNAQYF
jgi:hypothetical protein